MLRTVRSLPSLRLLAQQHEKTASLASLAKTELVTGSLFVPNPPKSTHTAESVRSVHSTSKKSTVLLDSHNNNSKYTTMNLNGLKMECKKRGLKVSGRKIELIQRLSNSDAAPVESARSLNTSAQMGANTQQIPPFKNTPSKIAQELMNSKSKAERDSKMEEIIKKELKTRISNEKKLAEELQLEKSKKQATKKAKELERQMQEQRAREEVRIQNEKLLEKEKLASAQRVKELELAQERANQAAKIQKEIIDKSVRGEFANNIRKQTLVNAQSKSNIINEAKAQLKTHAKQTKQEQQNKQSSSDSQSELSFRDKVFLSGFVVTTGTWWNLS